MFPKISGSKDAMAMFGVGAGIAASSPLLAGSMAGLGLAAGPAFTGYHLYWRELQKKLSRVNRSSREGFVLPSDAPFKIDEPGAQLSIGLTRDTATRIEVSNDSLMRHLAIIGQSGVGKTTLGMYMLWQQMVRGGGYIFIDAKLDVDTRNQLAYMARCLGEEEKFQVLNIDDPDNSHTYNPIISGDADEDASKQMLLLPASDNNAGADFYRSAVNYALTIILGALKAANLRYTFDDISILLQSGPAMELLQRQTPHNTPERKNLDIFLERFKKFQKDRGFVLDTEKMKEVLGGMTGRIGIFSQGKFGKVFNTYTPEIDLYDTLLNKKYLYVMLPTMGKDVQALMLGKMVLADLRTAIYKIQKLAKHERQWPPALVFADEMGSYVMEGIARIFEQARSAHICMMPGFQAFSNLAEVSPNFERMIIQNTWTKTFFKFGDSEEATKAADNIGLRGGMVYSMSASQSESSSAQNLRTSPQGSSGEAGGLGESFREMDVHWATPDNLSALGKGQMIAISGGRRYHMNVPMLSLPKNPEELGVFRCIRKPTPMPEGITAFRLGDRYREFMSADPNAKDEPPKEYISEPQLREKHKELYASFAADAAKLPKKELSFESLKSDVIATIPLKLVEAES